MPIYGWVLAGSGRGLYLAGQVGGALLQGGAVLILVPVFLRKCKFMQINTQNMQINARSASGICKLRAIYANEGVGGLRPVNPS